jgi:hypothetical protein
MDVRKKNAWCRTSRYPHKHRKYSSYIHTVIKENKLLQLQVMNIRTKLLDAEHPDTLLSMENITVTYYN